MNKNEKIYFINEIVLNTWRIDLEFFDYKIEDEKVFIWEMILDFKDFLTVKRHWIELEFLLFYYNFENKRLWLEKIYKKYKYKYKNGNKI